MTLFEIEASLEQLFEIRDEAQYDGDSEALKAIDQQIAEYLTKEAAKIDSYAGLIRRLESEAETCQIEANRLAERAKAKLADVDRLKTNALAAMQRFDVKELKTPTTTMRRQKNGGLQSLNALVWDVPQCYRRVTAVMTYALWIRLVGGLTKIELREVLISNVDVDNDAIREALSRGEDIYGAKLLPRGEHVRLS